MKPYQERVVAEKRELDDRVNKLHAFLESPVSDEVDRQELVRLGRQLQIMREYAGVLAERIEAFKE